MDKNCDIRLNDLEDISVFDVNDLHSILGAVESDEILTPGVFDDSNEDLTLRRLSLAYENLRTISVSLINEIGPYVRILDISNNQFENLDFLEDFTELTHLICDKNQITPKTVFPYLPKLELLWLNNCKIDVLCPWAKKLRYSCPNLKYVALMGNPGAPTFWNNDNIYEYLQYRLFIISLFPKLQHLDDKMVSEDERKQAKATFECPMNQKLTQKTQENLPNCFRNITKNMSELFAKTSNFTRPKGNLVI